MTRYPWQEIDPKDYILIEALDGLTMQDVHVLTRLYQPIIGGDAHSLYLRLFADIQFEARTNSVTISEMLRKLDVGIPDFYKARVKLEGIGLLQVFRSKESKNEYIYQVVPPLSAKGFFKDSLLYTLLLEKIGERLFKEEINTFLPDALNKQSYEELTHSFLDVFHFDLEHANLATNTHYQVSDESNQPKLAETIENVDTFDYRFFKAGLSKHFVRQDAFTAEIKELIYTFHVVYGIDELTMQNLVLESADVETGKINKNKFISTVQRVYLNKQRTQPVRSPQVLQNSNETSGRGQTKVEPVSETSQNAFSNAETQVIENAKQMAPANYLRSIKDQKGGFVTSNETWVLKELVESSRLSKDVINILIHYILVVKESVILEKNYAMKIANDWAQSGVRTPEDAILKVKELYKQSQNQTAQPQARATNQRYQRNYKSTRKKETLPDWAKEEYKPQTSETTTKSFDEGALKNRLDQIRKLREQKEDS